MGRPDWNIVKEHKFTKGDIATTAVQAYTFPTLFERRYGGCRGFKIDYDGDVNAKLLVEVNDQRFILSEGQQGIIAYPDEDVQTEFLGMKITNEGTAQASNVTVSFQVFKRST